MANEKLSDKYKNKIYDNCHNCDDNFNNCKDEECLIFNDNLILKDIIIDILSLEQTIEHLQENQKELIEALKEIIDFGKRDITSNELWNFMSKRFTKYIQLISKIEGKK